MARFLQLALYNGGFTLEPSLRIFTENQGFMVALTGFEKKFKLSDSLAKIQFEHYVKEYAKQCRDLIKNSGIEAKVGAWVDNGIVYLDISEHIETKEKAMFTAKLRSQLAIYDLNTKESIYV